jgi:hypothetical protein
MSHIFPYQEWYVPCIFYEQCGMSHVSSMNSGTSHPFSIKRMSLTSVNRFPKPIGSN